MYQKRKVESLGGTRKDEVLETGTSGRTNLTGDVKTGGVEGTSISLRKKSTNEVSTKETPLNRLGGGHILRTIYERFESLDDLNSVLYSLSTFRRRKEPQGTTLSTRTFGGTRPFYPMSI